MFTSTFVCHVLTLFSMAFGLSLTDGRVSNDPPKINRVKDVTWASPFGHPLKNPRTGVVSMIRAKSTSLLIEINRSDTPLTCQIEKWRLLSSARISLLSSAVASTETVVCWTLVDQNNIHQGWYLFVLALVSNRYLFQRKLVYK